MTGRRLVIIAGLLLIGVLIALRVADGTARESRTAGSVTAVQPTRRSAVRAAVSALYALSVPALTSRQRFDLAVHQLAAPGARESVEATFGAINPKLTAAFRHRPVVLRGAPLGYRFERYSRRAAAVAIWTVTLAATPRFPGTAQWRTLIVELVWTTRGWKVTGGAGTSGPDPTTPLHQLAGESDRFRSFVHVP